MELESGGLVGGGRAERVRGGGEGEGTLVCKSRARGVYTVYS